MKLLDAARKAAGFLACEEKEANEAIIDGRVSVNGVIYTDPEFEVAPGSLVRYSAGDWSGIYIVHLP